MAAPQKGKELASRTTALLKQRAPEDFLKSLTDSVLQAYVAAAGDLQELNGDSRTTAAARHEERKAALSLLPASVAASVIMASLGVEEFPSTSSSVSSQSSNSAKSMPLSRHLAEELLQAQSAPLASPPASASTSTSEDRARLVSSYSRVLELYAIHILGVRCAQWEEADQVVRLSLLEDEERAKLLVALERAREHVVTRPERRASAKLAGEKAYELEKQRRKAEEKGLQQQQDQQQQKDSSATFMRPERPASTSTSTVEKSRRSRPPVGRHRYSSSSASSSSSSIQPSSETESDSTITVNKAAKNRSSHSHTEGTVPSQRGDEDNTSSTTAAAAAEAFASTRSALSTRLAKDAQRDGSSATSSGERGSVAPRSSAGAASTSSLVQTLRSLLALDKLPLSGSVLLSVLGPLLVLLFSLKRLTTTSRGRRAGGSGGVGVGGGTGAVAARGGAARRAGGSNEAGLLTELVQRLWNTVRMGTKVTYL